MAKNIHEDTERALAGELDIEEVFSLIQQIKTLPEAQRTTAQRQLVYRERFFEDLAVTQVEPEQSSE